MNKGELMSTDPTGLDGEGCVEATKKKYINAEFNRNDWCGFKGICLVDNMITGKERACLLCKYRVGINVPLILNKRMKEKEGL